MSDTVSSSSVLRETAETIARRCADGDPVIYEETLTILEANFRRP